MRRRNHAQALKGAAGTCRDRRRPQGRRQEAWVRPLRRVNHAIDASVRLLCSSLRTAAASSRRAPWRPVRASRDLHGASMLLIRASLRLMRVAQELEEATARAAREPENAGDAPQLIAEATERWLLLAGLLNENADRVFSARRAVLEDLRTGALVPERPADPRPRIILAPRPVPIRAFLILRQPRVADRIASLLRRRRRTPRPAALRVPRRAILGRAPPLFSTCLL